MNTKPPARRNICFVTGTRAEFGLMRSTLRQIYSHRRLRLQLIATGMHLDPSRGKSIHTIRDDGWQIDRTIPWRAGNSSKDAARATGLAMAKLADAYEELQSDIVLVVGDRVEAFAAASAAHISGKIVAHVHGGDRALGQVDDSLRHAISKLAHVHFPATASSAKRLIRLGEDRWRVHTVGSPGLDDLADAEPWESLAKSFPSLAPRQYALLALHPQDSSSKHQGQLADQTIAAIERADIEQLVVMYPNNDPGSSGIVRSWQAAARRSSPGFYFVPNLPRSSYLGLLKESALLVGNSSSGIIEAASFGVPVIDIGTRQQGREHGKNVQHVPDDLDGLTAAIAANWRHGKPRRFPCNNPYGNGDSGKQIAAILAKIDLKRHVRKLIAY